MRITLALALAVALLPFDAQAQTLDIYLIDVEGGQATLYVSPTGESLLVDTGWPGDRDADRIVEVMRAAGVDRIDHLVISHYHVDHIGGLPALVERVPIGHFYDHGDASPDDDSALEFARSYAEIHAGSPRTILRPGDRIPFAGTDVLVVASHDQLIQAPIAGAPGAGQANAACASFTPRDRPEPDPDNDHSVGFVMSFGSFRTINLGDLTWDREFRLMCPNNPIGTIDLYLTSHHGVDRSGSAVLVHALRPRAAIMNNGTRKGGAVSALEIMRNSPGLGDIWQAHWSHHGLVEHNSPGVMIANVDDPATLASVISPPDPTARPSAGNQNHEPAHYIKVSARQDGSFTTTNSRTEFTREYPARD